MEKTKSRLQTERVTKVIVVCNRLVPGSSPGRTAKNVMAVVSWWRNHLKNLRSGGGSGSPLVLGTSAERHRTFESCHSETVPVSVSGNSQRYLLTLTKSKTREIFRQLSKRKHEFQRGVRRNP